MGRGSSCSCWIFLLRAVGTPALIGGMKAPRGSWPGTHGSAAGASCRGNWAWKIRNSGIVWKWGGRGRQRGEAAAGGAEGWDVLWGVPTAALGGAVPAPCSTLFPPCLSWSHSGSWCCWVRGSSSLIEGWGSPNTPAGTGGAVFGVRPANPGRDWDALGTGSQVKGTGSQGKGTGSQGRGQDPLVVPMSSAGAMGGWVEMGQGDKTRVFCGILQGSLYTRPQCSQLEIQG